MGSSTSGQQKSSDKPTFSWLRTDTTSVQLNPFTAIAKSDSEKKFLFSTGGLALLAVIGIMLAQSLGREQTTTVNANVNLQKSLVGTISQVEPKENQFTLRYQSSLDESIQTSGVTDWLVRLPPGEDIVTGKTLGITCYTLPDVTQYAAQVTPAKCQDILQSGKRVLVEYLVMRKTNGSLVARTIIGEKK